MLVLFNQLFISFRSCIRPFVRALFRSCILSFIVSFVRWFWFIPSFGAAFLRPRFA